MTELVTASNATTWSVDPNLSIWGVDAQQVWKDLAERKLIRDGNKVLVASAKGAEEATHDPSRFSSGPDAQFLGSESGLIPLQIDPPDHVRYRKLLDPLLSPRRVASLEPDVVALANRCIDGFIESGSCEFGPEFAIPLPCGIFLSWLGLPLEGLNEFVELKERLIRPEAATEEQRNEIRADAGSRVFEFFRTALDDRRTNPADDTIGYLAALEADDTLSREETLNICNLLLIAGLDTVSDALDCFFAFLASHPTHREQLVQDPTLVNAAVEELLRYETPVPTLSRVCTLDTEVDGCPVHQGDKMQVLLGSTNLSAAVPENPDIVDFHRSENRHISFGTGIHRCLGSHLARLELRVALREWHLRIPEYSLPEGLELLYGVSLREIPNLRLTFPAGQRHG